MGDSCTTCMHLDHGLAFSTGTKERGVGWQGSLAWSWFSPIQVYAQMDASGMQDATYSPSYIELLMITRP